MAANRVFPHHRLFIVSMHLFYLLIAFIQMHRFYSNSTTPLPHSPLSVPPRPISLTDLALKASTFVFFVFPFVWSTLVCIGSLVSFLFLFLCSFSFSSFLMTADGQIIIWDARFSTSSAYCYVLLLTGGILLCRRLPLIM